MNQHQTSLTGERKTVTVKSNQKKYWVEFQLVDEEGEAVANMPYRAVNLASHSGDSKKYDGSSDARGIISIEGLERLSLTLFIKAQALTDEMESRPLRAGREESDSEVKEVALHNGHRYHYVKIGELCDATPEISDWVNDALPEFHFPEDTALKGLTISEYDLEKRHVVEICPFRAWVLKLHHNNKYSVVNAHNLGIMADLAYNEKDVVDVFFNRKCLDLSQVPEVSEEPGVYYSVVIDVPFSQRYLEFVFIDTNESETPEGTTQLFYVYNKEHVVVAWRGTWTRTDALTDASFRPIPCPEIVAEGQVHYGFISAFRLAKKLYPVEFDKLVELLSNCKLFLCGHSLGGALALINSAELRSFEPVLYTYGMPRTFTASAILSLTDIIHFRHVNDADTVPCVPPQADLDSWLYNIYGPPGLALGFYWSYWKMLPQTILKMKFGDPFWHHGSIVAFFTAQQSVVQTREQPILWIGGGVGATPKKTIQYRYIKVTKLYLVPELNVECSRRAEENQKAFIKCIDDESLERFFPKHTNAELDTMITDPRDHSMSGQYMPFINNQLIELVDKKRKLNRKIIFNKFIEQMKKSESSMTNDIHETNRNHKFIQLQEMLSTTLAETESDNAGKKALLRFSQIAKENNEIIH